MQPTGLSLGAWNTLTDAFQAHPNAPTNQIFNLNDGVLFTLVDPTGLGEGFSWGKLAPDIYAGGNPRVPGQRVTQRNYGKNRMATAHLFWGQGTDYASWMQGLRNLIQLCEGISAQQPAALSIQVSPASQPVYADVVSAHVNVDYHELLWAQLLDDGVEVVFECRPFLRGTRRTLSNLLCNPGFEAPSGPGVPVFSDTLANTLAYSVQAGGPLTQDRTLYTDVVMADGPRRYYRMDETAGATLYDASTRAQNGTLNAGTFAGANVAGALVGDTDTAISFGGGYVTVPTAGLPTGNAAWTLECWAKWSAVPAAGQLSMMATFGTPGTAGAAPWLGIDSSGKVFVSNTGGGLSVGSLAVPALNAWHHVVGTFDGATMTLYVDGVSQGTAAGTCAVVLAAAYVAAYQPGVNPYLWLGGLDEVAIYGTALSAARVTAHYSTGTAAPVARANSMQLPAGARVAFGSPNWTAINSWTIRLRYYAGATVQVYLHYVDANNWLGLQLTNTQMTVQKAVAGVVTNLAAGVAITLVNGLVYILTLTQFPTLPGWGAYVQATLKNDDYGAPDALTTATTVAGPVRTQGYLSALSGRPQIATAGAALGVDATRAPHSVSLFGPGGWGVVGTQNGATGTASGAWEQNPLSTIAVPVVSAGAARLDLPPAGTVDAYWHEAGGAQFQVPVRTPGDALDVVAQARSSGLSATAELSLVVNEYDAPGGTLLRSTSLAARTGEVVTWTQFAGRVVTGASTAAVDLALRVREPTAGASANASVWWENAQCWNESATGQTTMPYCELRSSQSPAQLLVTGIEGDVETPATVALGAFAVTFPVSMTWPLALGRRALVGANVQLVGQTVADAVSTPALDNTSFGGFYTDLGAFTTLLVYGLQVQPSQARGQYHLLQRFRSAQATFNAITVRARGFQSLVRWFTGTAAEQDAAEYLGPLRSPLSSTQWTVVDVGAMPIPLYAQGAMVDPAATYVNPNADWGQGTGADANANWLALLPVDGSLLLGSVNNPANSINTPSNVWLFVYADGLGAVAGLPASWTYSIEPTALPKPSRGVSGSSALNAGPINLTSGAAPYLTLDPRLRLAGTSVNQLVGYIADQTAAVLALAAEIIYTPLYLAPQ